MNIENKTISAIVAIAFGILLGLSVVSGGEGISDSEPVHRIEPELEKYLTSFVDLAALKGIDLSYIYDYDIIIIYASNDSKNRVATSYGRNKDKIVITVYKPRFEARTEEGRKYVMFHEFGHDILNMRHLSGGHRGMMEPTAYTGFFKNYERFSKEKQENYLYKSLNKMFDRHTGAEEGAVYLHEDHATDWELQTITKTYYKYDGELLTGIKVVTEDMEGNIVSEFVTNF